MKRLTKTLLLVVTAVTVFQIATRLKVVNTGIYQPYEIKAKYGAAEVDPTKVRKVFYFE